MATSESASLALLTRLLLNLFPADTQPERRSVVVGALGEQIETFVRRSRGQELEHILENDPYGRLTDVIDGAAAVSEFNVDGRRARCAELVGVLLQTRTDRLASESLSLPEVHFQILSATGILLLVGFALTGAAQLAGGNPTFGSLGELCSHLEWRWHGRVFCCA